MSAVSSKRNNYFLSTGCCLPFFGGGVPVGTIQVTTFHSKNFKFCKQCPITHGTRPGKHPKSQAAEGMKSERAFYVPVVSLRYGVGMCVKAVTFVCSALCSCPLMLRLPSLTSDPATSRCNISFFILYTFISLFILPL